jgi:uncharacterized protein
MPRKYFRKYLPTSESIQNHRFLARFSRFLKHPNLWHLNRRSVSGGVAVGLFAGMVPGPFQMISGALLAVPLRVNLPVAVLLTFYTNPFTIVPLYWVAFQIGSFFIDSPGAMMPPPDFSWSEIPAWIGSVWHWGLYYGKPVLLGLFLLAATLAACGYVIVQVVWRLSVMLAWRRRGRRRAKKALSLEP